MLTLSQYGIKTFLVNMSVEQPDYLNQFRNSGRLYFGDPTYNLNDERRFYTSTNDINLEPWQYQMLEKPLQMWTQPEPFFGAVTQVDDFLDMVQRVLGEQNGRIIKLGSGGLYDLKNALILANLPQELEGLPSASDLLPYVKACLRQPSGSEHWQTVWTTVFDNLFLQGKYEQRKPKFPLHLPHPIPDDIPDSNYMTDKFRSVYASRYHTKPEDYIADFNAFSLNHGLLLTLYAHMFSYMLNQSLPVNSPVLPSTILQALAEAASIILYSADYNEGIYGSRKYNRVIRSIIEPFDMQEASGMGWIEADKFWSKFFWAYTDNDPRPNDDEDADRQWISGNFPPDS